MISKSSIIKHFGIIKMQLKLINGSKKKMKKLHRCVILKQLKSDSSRSLSNMDLISKISKQNKRQINLKESYNKRSRF